MIFVIRGITLGSIPAILMSLVSLLRAQPPKAAPRPNALLPVEAAGLDAVVRALIGAFDQADIVALGEAHERQVDSELRIALVRHPDFAKRVRTIVIEYGSASEQSTLDRYIRGEQVSAAQLQQVWKTAAPGANGLGDHPVYADFLRAIRDVNSTLPADARIRVLAGDPRSREIPAFSVLKAAVRERHGKALLIYGGAHFFLTGPAAYLASQGDGIRLAQRLDIDHPGRWLSVIPIGALARPAAIKAADLEPEYGKFDRALTTQLRPVLVSFQRVPFRDFTAEEFLGRTLITCRPPGGCRSVFKGSTLTLGQMADAGVYLGAGRPERRPDEH